MSWKASASHAGATKIVVTRRAFSVKKQSALGKTPMSHEEAKLRLKRWYVTGLIETFDPEIARTSHIKFGGRGLNKLGSTAAGWCTISEEDLNEMLRRASDG